ncbi:hypothetical protein BDR03DRAFT_961525 [Suillus americanus]|nr:hypothetical protein BDR03DRAFT_961525 [Suillus americanus]
MMYPISAYKSSSQFQTPSEHPHTTWMSQLQQRRKICAHPRRPSGSSYPLAPSSRTRPLVHPPS